MISEPDSKSWRELEQVFPGTQRRLTDLNIVSRIKMVVEPDTHLTHRFEIELRMGFYNNEEPIREQVLQRVNQYRYD